MLRRLLRNTHFHRVSLKLTGSGTPESDPAAGCTAGSDLLKVKLHGFTEIDESSLSTTAINSEARPQVEL
jgi:hypothetical protein